MTEEEEYEEKSETFSENKVAFLLYKEDMYYIFLNI